MNVEEPMRHLDLDQSLMMNKDSREYMYSGGIRQGSRKFVTQMSERLHAAEATIRKMGGFADGKGSAVTLHLPLATPMCDVT